jgi:DNA-binding transcriptional ArsR family regulator
MKMIQAPAPAPQDFSDLGHVIRDDDINRAYRHLKAMSHPLRLRILCVLGDTELCVGDLVDRIGTSQSNISQHLSILHDKGMLISRKEANRVYYRIADPAILRLIAVMHEVFCTPKR